MTALPPQADVPSTDSEQVQWIATKSMFYGPISEAATQPKKGSVLMSSRLVDRLRTSLLGPERRILDWVIQSRVEAGNLHIVALPPYQPDPDLDRQIEEAVRKVWGLTSSSPHDLANDIKDIRELAGADATTTKIAIVSPNDVAVLNALGIASVDRNEFERNNKSPWFQFLPLFLIDAFHVLIVCVILVTLFGLGAVLFQAIIVPCFRLLATLLRGNYYGFVFVGTLVTFVAGVVAFALRSHRRMIYGSLEGAVGTFMIFHSIPTTVDLKEFNWLGVAGGLYVIVRALDNIGKALRDGWEGHRLAEQWKAIFGDKYGL